MTRRILPLLALLPFAACADTEAGLDGPAAEAPAVTASAVPVVRPADVTVGAVAPPAPIAPPLGGPVIENVSSRPLDPLAPPPAEGGQGIAVGEPNPAAPSDGRLGTTVASLGSPTDPGLWLETALVSEPRQGTISYNGQTVGVQLRPSGGDPGSGSQISLEAMRALGAPLTGLPEITVFGG